MINRILLVFIFLFSVVAAQAQDLKWLVAPSLGIDVGGAVVIPLSDIPDGAKGSPKIMPNIGVGVQYNIHEKWNLGIELNYHVLSFTASADVISQPYYSDDGSYAIYFSGETETECELKFVEFPLMAYYKLNSNWSIVIGMYYSRIIDSRFEVEGSNGWISENKEDTDTAPLPGTQNVAYDFNDEMSSHDLGAIIGFQYKIGAKILFWSRFHAGLNSVFKPEFQNISYELYQMRLSTGVSFTLFSGEK
ncbi:MAG: PorT family protein [Reichenbachiella sp.]